MKVKCNFGTIDAVITFPDEGVEIDGNPCSQIPASVVPFLSTNCGMCKSLMNPQVAAATAAAMGSLTPQPCLKPVLAMGGAQKTEVCGQPTGTKEGTIFLCPFGGKLTLTDPGQTKSTAV